MGEKDENKLGNRRENRDGAEKMCYGKRADWLWEMKKEAGDNLGFRTRYWEYGGSLH